MAGAGGLPLHSQRRRRGGGLFSRPARGASGHGSGGGGGCCGVPLGAAGGLTLCTVAAVVALVVLPAALVELRRDRAGEATLTGLSVESHGADHVEWLPRGKVPVLSPDGRDAGRVVNGVAWRSVAESGASEGARRGARHATRSDNYGDLGRANQAVDKRVVLHNVHERVTAQLLAAEERRSALEEETRSAVGAQIGGDADRAQEAQREEREAAVGDPFDLKSVSVDRSTIFVSLAAFVDPECPLTVQSLFKNAANPDRVSVGIVQQNLSPDWAERLDAKESNVDCFNEFCKTVGVEECERRRGQVTVRRQDALDTKGVTVARYDAQQLLGDQRFYLQVDSHTYFARSWDSRYISMWLKTGNPRAILTSYPMGFEALEEPYMNGTVKKSQIDVMPRICRYDTLPGGGGIPVVANIAGASRVPATAAPELAAHWAAGQSFGPAQAERDAPYDKYAEFLFQGEEPYRAAQYWTRGYDFYSPNENVVFHHYRPPGKKYGIRISQTPVWGRQSTQEKLSKSLNRVFVMLGMASSGGAELHEMAPGDKYGIGSERTLEQYFEFAQYEPSTMRASASLCSRRTRVPTRTEVETNTSSIVADFAVHVPPKPFDNAKDQYCSGVKTSSSAFVDGFVPIKREGYGMPYVCDNRGECKDASKLGVRFETGATLAEIAQARDTCLRRDDEGAVVGVPISALSPQIAARKPGQDGELQLEYVHTSERTRRMSPDEFALARVRVSRRFAMDSGDRPTVTCVVRTAHFRLMAQARAVAATWGKRCDRLVFMSEETTPRSEFEPVLLPKGSRWAQFEDAMRNAFCQTRAQDATSHYLFVSDATYVIMENLWDLIADKTREVRERSNATAPTDDLKHAYSNTELYLGRRMNRGGEDGLFHNGAAGIVLSQRTLEALANELSGWQPGNTTTHHGAPAKRSCDFPGVQESADVALSWCLKRRLGIEPISTAANAGGDGGTDLSSSSERFFPFTAGEHALMATSNSWFWKYSESKGEGVSTISPTAVSFDGLKLKDMFRYDIWLHCARGGKAD